MAIKYLLWLTKLRGIEPTERNLLLPFCDACNDDGYVESFRMSRICEGAEVKSRRAYQILKHLEEKGLLERVSRAWDVRSNGEKAVEKIERKVQRPDGRELVYHVMPKTGGGKQIPTGYRLQIDRMFPAGTDQSYWRKVIAIVKDSKQIPGGTFHVWVESIKETCYVQRTGTLFVIVPTTVGNQSEHARWLKAEFVPLALRLAVDLRPEIAGIRLLLQRVKLSD